MAIALEVRLAGHGAVTVDNSLTVPAVSPPLDGLRDTTVVFDTAYVVSQVEPVSIGVRRDQLLPHLDMAGTHIDSSHGAATPVGMRITVYRAGFLACTEARSHDR